MPEGTTAAVSTVREALRTATGTLAAAGSETPRLDAELLLAEVLGVDRARLLMDADALVEGPPLASFRGLLARRAAREPVAYILGRRDFRRLTLNVDRRVLIPRPETELLVEAALSLPAGARVLDVGTGSGAVALALADERPDLEVWGSDISAEALIVARANADRLRLPVEFVQADLLDGVPGRFDAVVANLPYVAADAPLPPDVAAFEPTSALFGGADGLDVIRRLVGTLDGVPWVGLEIGWDQGQAVTELLAAAGFGALQRVQDLAGHDRAVVGSR